MVIRVWIIAGAIFIVAAWWLTVPLSPPSYQGAAPSHVEAYRAQGLVPEGTLIMSPSIGHDIFEVPAEDAEHAQMSDMSGMSMPAEQAYAAMPAMDTHEDPAEGHGPLPEMGTVRHDQDGHGAMPDMDTAQESVAAHGQMPAMDTHEDPAEGHGPLPEMGTVQHDQDGHGAMPGMDTAQESVAAHGQMPAMDTHEDSAEGHAQMPEMGTVQHDRDGHGAMPDMDTAQETAESHGQMPEMSAQQPGHGADGGHGAGGGLRILTAHSPRAAHAREIRVRMREWGFEPARVEVAAGEVVRLVVQNAGNNPHEFMLMSHAAMAAVNYRLQRADWNLLEHEALYEREVVMPGNSIDITLGIEQPGAWMFMCMFPYHMQFGMMGTMATEGMGTDMDGMPM